MSPRPVKKIPRLVENIFLNSETVDEGVLYRTIRTRVERLLKLKHPDMTQEEIGSRIGRGGSWVSAFLKGERPATDVTLIVRIARFLGVPAGFLLGDPQYQGREAMTALVDACQDLSDEDLGQLAALAKKLPKQASGPTAEEPTAESPAPRPSKPRKRQ